MKLTLRKLIIERMHKPHSVELDGVVHHYMDDRPKAIVSVISARSYKKRSK